MSDSIVFELGRGGDRAYVSFTNGGREYTVWMDYTGDSGVMYVRSFNCLRDLLFSDVCAGGLSVGDKEKVLTAFSWVLSESTFRGMLEGSKERFSVDTSFLGCSCDISCN